MRSRDTAERAGSAVLLVAAGALSWWEGGEHYGTTDSRIGVLVVTGVALVACLALGVRRQRRTTRQALRHLGHWHARLRRRAPAYRIGAYIWLALVGAVVVWDLASFLAAMHAMPTLSYFSGRVTRFHVGKSVEFLAWCLAGAYIAAGWRRPETAG